MNQRVKGVSQKWSKTETLVQMPNKIFVGARVWRSFAFNTEAL
jgi:hypothetical protein